MKKYFLPIIILCTSALAQAISAITDGFVSLLLGAISVVFFIWATKGIINAYTSSKNTHNSGQDASNKDS